MNKLERRGLKLKKRVGDAKCDDKNNYQYNIHNLKTLRKWKQLLCVIVGEENHARMNRL